MTNVVWDRFLEYDWRSKLVALSERGLITATEMVRRGYADVPEDEQAILALIRQSLRIRPGFEQLLSLCESKNWHFAVLSNGLRFYIEATLGNRLEIWAHDAHFDTRWHVELPQNLPLDPQLDFKCQVLSELKRQYRGSPCFYIGDGRLDFEPARLCDKVFCVRDSSLERLCEHAGLPKSSFTDFSEICDRLSEERLEAAARSG
jgi:2-hydroxy-3-keto-5-methylthiopentenyl-1-phosphate phosphatase